MSTTPSTPSFSPIPLENRAFDANTAEVVNPRGIQPTYANNAGVMAMQHDLRLVFSEIVTDSGTGETRLELRANVAMTPTMMKALHEAIGKTLELYETGISEIPWPPQPRKTK